MDGVPFVFNPAISIEQAITFDVSYHLNLWDRCIFSYIFLLFVSISGIEIQFCNQTIN